MTISIWRFTHLSIAIIASFFLIIASATGVVLAFDAAQENWQPYQSKNFKQLTLAETIPTLKKNYPEITEITIDDNGFVLLEGIDTKGNSVKGYIDPQNGKFLGKPMVKSDFINWNIQLHRSLFLKETGRFLVGIVSILLVLMCISGLALLLKRQQGYRKFFANIKDEYFSQYLHVYTGRLLLLPLLFITLTAAYLFLYRFDFITKEKTVRVKYEQNKLEKLSMTEFSSFKQTKLSDVRKIEFPFIEDDPDENFVIQLKNKTISVNQINGAIVESKATPKTEIYENMNLKLHTGRGNWLLALVLGISSLGVLAFIYTGFAITRKRTKNKIKNSFSAENAEIIILVGSENGSTMGFANTIHHQFLSLHKKSYLSTLNRYQPYPKAEHLILMTSTYGLGDAPSNANQFEKLLNTILQQQIIKVSIVGFGSKSYEEYAAFAEKIQNKIGKKDLFQIITPLVKINDASTHDFVEWAKAWSAESMIPLATTPSLYAQKKQHLKTFEVVGKTEIVEETTTFTLILKPKQKSTFQSGDLLAIYPNHDGAVRYYSVGKVGGNIQLVVKLHKNGLGSGYLYHLNTGHELKAKIMVNEDFHCTKKMKSVIMIANGTGIAPFLGMIEENTHKTEIQLYAGFRKNSELTKAYQKFAAVQKNKGQVHRFELAYSREDNPQYVMDLVRRDADIFIKQIKNKEFIMICGALKMQRDIEKILSELCIIHNLDFEKYKKEGFLLTDCY